jgi:soluble lytic murein transglycosylase
MLTTLLLALSISSNALAPACAHVDNANTAPTAILAAPATESAPAMEVLAEPGAGMDQGDDALAGARRLDSEGRAANGGELPNLTPQEHLRRASVYLANRAFAEARGHWAALIARYPGDPAVAPALFGTGRSFYVERRYAEALPFFERLGREFQGVKDGREGFYYVAATILRLGRPADAAARYLEYAEKFPAGERVESAYLNAIDSWREAGRNDLAAEWVARTRERYRGKAAEANALFALLRLQVSAAQWQSAVRTADELRALPFPAGVGTTQNEVAYLRAYSLERAKQTAQAVVGYQSIPDRASSYYGWLATERLEKLGADGRRSAASRASAVKKEIAAASGNYPAPFRDAVLRIARARDVDPRFVYSIMRQESGYNPRARSQAGARGLLQMTIDMAGKYGPAAGFRNVTEDDLYRPEVNVAVGVEYLAELFRQFPGLHEAVAASYNGGEDNVVRWVRRSVQKDAGVFTSEIGFAESKDYAQKVLANYRAYKLLYNSDLRPQR